MRLAGQTKARAYNCFCRCDVFLATVFDLAVVQGLNVARVRRGIMPFKFRELLCRKLEPGLQYIKGNVPGALRCGEGPIITIITCIVVTCGQQSFYAYLHTLLLACWWRKVLKQYFQQVAGFLAWLTLLNQNRDHGYTIRLANFASGMHEVNDHGISMIIDGLLTWPMEMELP